MTSPLAPLLASIESLLKHGRDSYGIPATFEDIPVYRGDQLDSVNTPFVQISQDGPAKERHVKGSGVWEIPISVRLVLDANGDLGDSPQEIEESIRAYADDLEAVLTRNLRLNPMDEADGYSTPEERLVTDALHVWEIIEVEVSVDTEMDDDPVCEVTFTAVCSHAATIIPTA